MSCRQVNSANRRKAELIVALGSCCWACGALSPLHIDHPQGRDWQPRERSFLHRVNTYWKEHEQGLVRLLCEFCNDSRRFNGVVLPRPQALFEAVPEDMNPF